MKRKAIFGAVLAALIALAAWQLPWLQAGHYRTRIQAAIESSLNRKVEITGKLRFNLFTGFGFSLADVVIHEDPAIGIEPFAYVSSLNARISMASLLRGRWEVSRITLVEPTVNLVKHSSGTWNIRPLLRRSTAVLSLPEIQVRGGRINFKFGDTKSTVYCINSDVDITPASKPEMGIRFSVEPARTDRLAQGFGVLSGRGLLRADELDLNLDLERTAISDLAVLLEGHGAGLSGFLGSRARIHGPLRLLAVEGRARVEDVQQRYSLLNTGGGDWPIRYQGSLRFPEGELDIETRSEAEPAPLRLRLRARSLLDNPVWGSILQFREQPFGPVKGILQYLNVPLPERVSLDGKLNGVLGYSPAHGLQGIVQMPEASVKAAGASAKLTAAEFAIDRGALSLKPAMLDLGAGKTVEIQGSYRPDGHAFTWNTRDQPLPIELLRDSQRQLSGSAGIPLLDSMAQGEWSGVLRYQQSAETAAEWSGNVVLRNARIAVAGLAEPVLLRSASAAIRGNRVTLDAVNGVLGAVAFRASYRDQPQRLRLRIAEADLAEIERVLLPTLSRRGSFFARTLSRTPAAPEWLRDRRLTADVEIESLEHRAAPLGSLTARAVWNGTQIAVSNLAWKNGEAAGTGELTLTLARPEPEYRLTGELRGVTWKNGTVDAEGTVDSSGVGLSLIRNAAAVGRFTAHGLDLPDGPFQSVTGAFEFKTPVLRLGGLEASAGPETFTGQGRSEADGKLMVDLSSGQRRLKMTGTLWPFDLESRP